MKKFVLLYLALLFIVIRCDSGTVNPTETAQRKFVELPADSALGDTTRFDNYYMMHGSYGSTIQFNRQFTGGPFGQFGISATLTIEAGTIAASDSLLCLLSVNIENTSVSISPIKNYFAHPFKLTLKYNGLDLQNLDLDDLQFVNTDEKNVIIDVKYDSITMNYVTGSLEIVNAVIIYDPRIGSDSKYGWVRNPQ